MKKYALIGKNIQDSLSPVIHGAYGCQYDLLDIEEDKLEWALSLPYDGFNVTSPYKEKIKPFLNSRCVNIPVNTIVKSSIGWEGYCTDCVGFEKAVKQTGVNIECKIGIIGSGEMSKMIQKLIRNSEGIDGRNLHKNGFNSFAGFYGLINATPCQDYNLDGLSKNAWIMDLGYKDDTFIKAARARGNFAFNGMGMLIAQAEESQRIWNS